MLRFHSSKASIHGLGHIENERIGRDFNEDGIGRWRSQLRQGQASDIQRMLSPVMARFEYAM